jgi:ribulose-5-phosphate 4-epimerase/fuculose-1-phosphate aldolase
MKEGKIRFNTVFVSDRILSVSKLGGLKKWSKIFQESGLTPEVQGNFTGNLSFRSKDGFVITASGLKDKEDLEDICFVYVKAYDEQDNTFFVEGQTKPSSESIMHHLIYKTFGDVNAVFHGHNDTIIAHAEELGLPVTEKEYESGTVELAKEVLKVLGDHKLIVLRNHGFVSLGNTMKKAGELALATLNQSKKANGVTPSS